jgi:hypothetical protein
MLQHTCMLIRYKDFVYNMGQNNECFCNQAFKPECYDKARKIHKLYQYFFNIATAYCIKYMKCILVYEAYDVLQYL